MAAARAGHSTFRMCIIIGGTAVFSAHTINIQMVFAGQQLQQSMQATPAAALRDGAGLLCNIQMIASLHFHEQRRIQFLEFLWSSGCAGAAAEHAVAPAAAL